MGLVMEDAMQWVTGLDFAAGWFEAMLSSGGGKPAEPAAGIHVFFQQD
jgi:hypothetical protein